jgi:hypothetical protein
VVVRRTDNLCAPECHRNVSKHRKANTVGTKTLKTNARSEVNTNPEENLNYKTDNACIMQY